MNPKMTSKQIKEFVVVTNPKIIKLLLDETRKEIVFTYLVNQPMTVKQLSVAMNKKPGTVLHHVQKLKNAIGKTVNILKTDIIGKEYCIKILDGVKTCFTDNKNKKRNPKKKKVFNLDDLDGNRLLIIEEVGG